MYCCSKFHSFIHSVIERSFVRLIVHLFIHLFMNSVNRKLSWKEFTVDKVF